MTTHVTPQGAQLESSSAEDPRDLGWFAGLLACPDCKHNLTPQFRCTECGAAFSVQDGTPSLFPRRGDRDVTFRYNALRSTRNADFDRCFSFPAHCGAAGADGPYHLDHAHATLF